MYTSVYIYSRFIFEGYGDFITYTFPSYIIVMQKEFERPNHSEPCLKNTHNVTAVCAHIRSVLSEKKTVSNLEKIYFLSDGSTS